MTRLLVSILLALCVVTPAQAEIDDSAVLLQNGVQVRGDEEAEAEAEEEAVGEAEEEEEAEAEDEAEAFVEDEDPPPLPKKELGDTIFGKTVRKLADRIFPEGHTKAQKRRLMERAEKRKAKQVLRQEHEDEKDLEQGQGLADIFQDQIGEQAQSMFEAKTQTGNLQKQLESSTAVAKKSINAGTSKNGLELGGAAQATVDLEMEQMTRQADTIASMPGQMVEAAEASQAQSDTVRQEALAKQAEAAVAFQNYMKSMQTAQRSLYDQQQVEDQKTMEHLGEFGHWMSDPEGKEANSGLDPETLNFETAQAMKQAGAFGSDERPGFAKKSHGFAGFGNAEGFIAD